MEHNNNFSKISESINSAAINSAIASVKSKSVGVSLLLTLFFGPLGMLYSTIFGAVAMLFLPIVVFFGMFTSAGGFILGMVFFVFYWLICIIWGAVATNCYNKKLLKTLEQELILSNHSYQAHLSAKQCRAALKAGNLDVAFKGFNILAKQGDSVAQCGLGYMYEMGYGVEQDFVQALKWYQISVEQNNSNAQYNLGGMYYNGRGVNQDKIKALEWLSRSAKQGNFDAIRLLEKLSK